MANLASQEKAHLSLLRSAEMCWRGKLRENSILNFPNRFVEGNGTPHFRLNDPVYNRLHPQVTPFSSISSVDFSDISF